MKNKSIFLLILVSFGLFSSQVAYSEQFTQISDLQANRIADAIFKIEGGNNTRWPYGIKSIKTNNPRQICINTIKNNYVRWQKSGKTNEFLFFLADKYCPPSCDPVGNRNWKKNITNLLEKSTKK